MDDEERDVRFLLRGEQLLCLRANKEAVLRCLFPADKVDWL